MPTACSFPDPPTHPYDHHPPHQASTIVFTKEEMMIVPQKKVV